MKDTLAKLTSNILNPFVVSIAVIGLLAVKSTSNIDDTVKLLLMTLAISVLPVLLMVYFLVRFRKLDSFFNNPREQRSTVYILTSLLGAVDCTVLWYFSAPKLVAVVFTAGFVAVIIFMIVNYFWKISLHTAFVAGSVVVLIIVYGENAAWSLPALPLIGWSRIRLKQHSFMQVIAGGLLAGLIAFVVFWSFGLVGKS